MPAELFAKCGDDPLYIAERFLLENCVDCANGDFVSLSEPVQSYKKRRLPVRRQRRKPYQIPIHVLRSSWHHEANDSPYVRGLVSEGRFLQLCMRFLREGRFPPWIVSFRRGTMADDRRNIDMWGHTSEGLHIPIQIKSKKWVVRQFASRPENRHIVCINAGPDASDNQIFSATCQGLAAKRKRLLAERMAME